MIPHYPIYIVSKNRWQDNRRLTAQSLEQMGVPYFIVVEESQYDAYRSVVDPTLATVLILDPEYQRSYDTCDDLGDTKSKGPGPARNFAWQHALDHGHAAHWVMDDNINGFCRLNHNMKVRVTNASLLIAMEDFTDRYSNVAMAGPNYRYFVNNQKNAPIILNTRIYSCNLIRNDIPFRWRGRYNEDTILSLDMLKAGWCTIQFNAFLQNKITTQAIKGGNTDEFYAVEGTLAKSEMQVREHPDVSRLVKKFGRWHHTVDYRPFKRTRLIKRPDVHLSHTPNEYGMALVRKPITGTP